MWFRISSMEMEDVQIDELVLIWSEQVDRFIFALKGKRLSFRRELGRFGSR